MPRNYLTDIEIVGATMVYQEGEICRWSLNWLYSNCNRVCILLDNYNEQTEKIVFEYRDKYPDMTRLVYSTDPVRPEKNPIAGQIKKRFKNRQNHIRQQVVVELKKMHEEKPINLLIWPDSDETFIEDFPRLLEEFWRQDYYEYMLLGFLEVYDSFRLLISQRMAPHGRVYKYKPELSASHYRGRTMYDPYYNERRPMKVRNVVVHMCQFNEEQRAWRRFTTNDDEIKIRPRKLWLLPKDVRQMTVNEIADYQPGVHQKPSLYPHIPLEEYLNNKEKYKDYL